ncbi:MAG: hypothetical protein ACON4C_03995 [Henriciella sp.]
MNGGSCLFDACIIVDWSAASRPATGMDSIWIGDRYRCSAGDSFYSAYNPSTRLAAQELLFTLIRGHLDSGRRVLVGFDFALGFPAGTARALNLDMEHGEEWRALHQLFADRMLQRNDNANDRFDFAEELNARMSGGASPFWGAPHRRPDSPYLSKTKRNRSVWKDCPSDHRRTDEWIKTRFAANPKSVWQLAYVGAVGSQVLLGLPTISALRDQLPESRIWPFETGFLNLSSGLPPDLKCIFSEVYPSTVQTRLLKGDIKDAEQVRALSRQLLNADKNGILGHAFGKPTGLEVEEIFEIVSEEGWILAI